MRPQTLITLVIVLGSGLFAGLASYQVMNRPKDDNAGKVPVLVALTPIKRGEALQPGKNFGDRFVDENLVNDEMLRATPEVMQEIQEKRFVAQFTIKDKAMLSKGQVGPASLGIIEQKLDKPGSRAVSIGTTTARATAGFIRPGSRVDLLLTPNEGKKQVRMFMRNVEVLAVDQESQNVQTAQGGKEIRMMTFLADTEQAQKITLAASAGEIAAILRGNGTDDGKTPAPLDLRTLLEGEVKEGEGEVAVTAEDVESMNATASMTSSLLDNVLATPVPTAGNGAVVTMGDTGTKVVPFRDVKGKVLFYVPVDAASPAARSLNFMAEDPDARTLNEIRKNNKARRQSDAKPTAPPAKPATPPSRNSFASL